MANTIKALKNMKTVHFFAMLVIFQLLSCKDESKELSTEEQVTVEDEDYKYNTYAEISMKVGGHWEGREYIGGSFKNVDSLEVPKEHTDHSWFIRYEGPGWENKNIGYRLYLDWRNAIDIFGKKVDSLVLPFVGTDGFDSYHESADWGQDILKAGKSMGIGGYGRFVNDSVNHFNNVGMTTAKVNNSNSESSIHINYDGWLTDKDTIDLDATLTIYPMGRHTKVELVPSKEINGLTTGIVKFPNIEVVNKSSKNGKWGAITTYGAQTLVSDTDQLGMAIIYRTEQMQELKEAEYDHLVIFKPSTSKITYYLVGAWQQELEPLSSQKAFDESIDTLLEEVSKNNN